MTSSEQTTGTATLPGATDAGTAAARTVLVELRAELAASYPAVGAAALLRIARRHRLDAFPPGFLVGGGIRDRGRDGAGAALRAAANGGSGHPLFSGGYYSLINPDVRAAGVSPWLHYQVFGRREGRSPHPLIDTATLSAWLPATLRPALVDEYLGDPVNWFAAPGPYVDPRSFVLHGNWDGNGHPLLQLLKQLDGPWVHRRLMLVDSASNDDARARLVAATFLLTRSGRSGLGALEIWDRHPATDGEQPATGAMTVVPGFFLGSSAGELRRPGNDVTSPDGTMVRLATGTIGLATGRAARATGLVFLEAPRRHEQLRELVQSAESGAAIAAHDRAQETAVRQLRRDLRRTDLTVLESGMQSRVLVSGAVRIMEAVDAGRVPAWDWDAGEDARDIAVVIPASQRGRATGDPRLRSLLTSGASLCLVDDNGLNSWLPVIQGRSRVLVDPVLLDGVGSFVAQSALTSLPPGDRSFG